MQQLPPESHTIVQQQMGGQPKENSLTAVVNRSVQNWSRQNGKVCPHQLSKSNCKLGALEKSAHGNEEGGGQPQF